MGEFVKAELYFAEGFFDDDASVSFSGAIMTFFTLRHTAHYITASALICALTEPVALVMLGVLDELPAESLLFCRAISFAGFPFAPSTLLPH